MTGHIVPPALAALPDPWRLSNHYDRYEAEERLPPGPEQRAAAVAALTVCLEVLLDLETERDPEGNGALPELFYDNWFGLERRFTQRMPTLSDISADAIRRWLRNDVDTAAIFGQDWVTPPDDVIEQVGRFWVASIVDQLTDELINWLRDAMRNDPSAPERAAVLAILKPAAPRLPWQRATVAILAIQVLGGAAEDDYFRQIENDHTVAPKTREEAAASRKAIERLA